MQILVTGGAGFIGNALLSRMSQSDFLTICLTEDYFQSEVWEKYLVSYLDTLSLEGVFHVGACSDTLEQDVNYMMIRNYESTKILANWCRENRVPLIYSSSAANYGVNGQHPSNLYGWSKYTSEDYVVSSGGIALRYFNVYGPGEEKKGNMASFLYQSFVAATQGKTVKLFPGNPKRDFIYIDDVVEANLYAFLNYDTLKGNYYEVSTGTSSSFEEMLDTFDIGYQYTEADEVPDGYQFFTRGNSEKWMNGWRPQFSLQTGTAKYRQHLLSNSD